MLSCLLGCWKSRCRAYACSWHSKDCANLSQKYSPCMSHRLGAACSEAQTNCNFPLPRCCQDLFAADIPTEICIGIIVQSTAQHIAFLGSANREELTGTMAYEVYKVLTQQQCERRNCAYMHSHKHPRTHPPARPPTHPPTISV